MSGGYPGVVGPSAFLASPVDFHFLLLNFRAPLILYYFCACGVVCSCSHFYTAPACALLLHLNCLISICCVNNLLIVIVII